MKYEVLAPTEFGLIWDLGWPFNLVWICEFREIDGVGIALHDHNFVLVYCCLLLLFASMLYFGRFV